MRLFIISLCFRTFQAAPSDVTILQQPAGPVYYDSSVIFTGSFTSSLLSVRNIRWQKLNGSILVDIDITGEKYTGSSVTGPSPKLVINSVQFIDKTTYGLVVSNGVGSNTSNNISLNIIGGKFIVLLIIQGNKESLSEEFILLTN